LPYQPNLQKKKQKCTEFSSVRDTVTIFTYMIGLTGL